MIKRDVLIAYICILSFAILVGFSFIGTKIAITAASPIETLAGRFGVSFLCVYILKKLKIFKINLTLNDYKVLSLLALFYAILFFGFQGLGLMYSSSLESGIVFAVGPALIAILAGIMLKEKPNFLQSLSIAISIAGVFYIFIMKGFSLKNASSLGLVLLFLGSFAQAIYNVLVRKFKDRFTPFEMSYGMFLVGAIFYVVVLLINHLIQGTLPLIFEPFKNPSFVAAVVYIGIGTTVLSTIFLNRALKSIEAYKAGIFQNLSTIISIFVGIIFLNEAFTKAHAIGAVLIILGVLGTNLFGRIRKKH